LLGICFPILCHQSGYGINLYEATDFLLGQSGGHAGWNNCLLQCGNSAGSTGILVRYFSPGLIGFFVLLGIFPLLANKIIDAIQANKIYATWLKPIRFDNNIVVIGAGGLVAAYIASAVKAKVT
jgi:hypothetical protein